VTELCVNVPHKLAKAYRLRYTSLSSQSQSHRSLYI